MNIPTIEESLFILNLTTTELLRNSTGFELRFFSLSDEQFKLNGSEIYTFTFPHFADYVVISMVYLLDVYGNRNELNYSNASASEVVIKIAKEEFQSLNNIIIKLDWNA